MTNHLSRRAGEAPVSDSREVSAGLSHPLELLHKHIHGPAQGQEICRGAGGVIFRIHVLHGVTVNAYSAFPTENEILLSPNSRFVVNQACRLDPVDGYHYVDMQEVAKGGYVF